MSDSEDTPLLQVKVTSPKGVVVKKIQGRKPWTDHQKLLYATIFCLMFMVVEVTGGFLANSLAIMTDAAHLLSDVAGFLISLGALWLGKLPPNATMSYGFARAEVIGAIISVMLIWALTGALVYEAISRIVCLLSTECELEPTNGKVMTIIAVCGFLVNAMMLKILGHGHSHGGAHGHSHGGHGGHGGNGGHSHTDNKITSIKRALDSRPHDEHEDHKDEFGHDHDHAAPHSHGHGPPDPAVAKLLEEKGKMSGLTVGAGIDNINVRAAYVHAIGDLVQSIGVCIAGVIVWTKPEWQIADPIATLFFSVIVMCTTIGVLKSSMHVLMEATPEGVDSIGLESGLLDLPTVLAVHDLHVWSLTVGKKAASVHLICTTEDQQKTLSAAQRYFHIRGIDHTTIQVETAGRRYSIGCDTCVDDVKTTMDFSATGTPRHETPPAGAYSSFGSLSLDRSYQGSAAEASADMKKAV